MKITAILVDDESVARDVLRTYLSKYCPDVELLGEAKNIIEATSLIKERKPELLFLDVEMPYGNAFDLLEATQDFYYETIFITAFSEYSLKALNQSAAYYILKPISIEELISAVEKVSKQIKENQDFNRTKIILENLHQPKEKQQITLPTQNGFDVAKLSDIIRIQADGNFVQVYFTNGKKKLICRFLKHFEQVLDKPFIRVHRSHIINLDYVVSYTKGSGGFITMNDGMEVEVSPTYKKALLDCF